MFELISNISKHNILLGLALIIIACQSNTSTPTGAVQFPEGPNQLAVYSDQIPWNPCPPNLPEGCEMYVLEGNPKEQGLYTIRIKTNKPFYIPAHTHPKDERVTVLQGHVYVAFGKDADRASASKFGPGDYYVNAPKAVHRVWADPGTIIQITGIGPWKTKLMEE